MNLRLLSLPVILLSLGVCTFDAQAATIYSGLQDFAIPLNFNGIYLDLDTGASAGASFAGWDVNMFFGGAGIANGSDFQPARTGTANLDAIITLSLGSTVDNSLNFSTGFGGSGNPNPHLGSGTGQFGVGSEGYLGFKWTTNVGAGPFFGWMRVTLTNNTGAPMLHDWAYENAGAPIKVGQTPEPGSGLLILTGTLAVALHRRRSR